MLGEYTKSPKVPPGLILEVARNGNRVLVPAGKEWRSRSVRPHRHLNSCVTPPFAAPTGSECLFRLFLVSNRFGQDRRRILRGRRTERDAVVGRPEPGVPTPLCSIKVRLSVVDVQLMMRPLLVHELKNQQGGRSHVGSIILR